MGISFRKAVWFGLIGILLIALAPLAADIIRPDVDITDGARKFANVLDDKTRTTVNAIHTIQSLIRSKGVKNSQYQQTPLFQNLYDHHGIMLFVFRDDSLILWSQNSIPPQLALRTAAEGREIFHFDNGWYRLVYLTDGYEEYVGSIRIQNTFPYQNQYLDNGFVNGFAQEGLVAIGTKAKPQTVKLRADHQAFYLHFDKKVLVDKALPEVFAFLSIIGGILLLLGIMMLSYLYLRRWPAIFVLTLTTIVLLCLRLLSIEAGWPGYVTKMGLFSPAVYASSSFFPSLADFIINASLLAIIALMIWYVIRRMSFSGPGKFLYLQLALLTGAILYFAIWINKLVKGLVVNSNIPYDINDITGLDKHSFVALAGAALLYFTYYIIAEAIIFLAARRAVNRSALLLTILFITLIYVLLTHVNGIRDLVFILWPPLIMLWIIYHRLFQKAEKFRLNAAVIVVVLFAFIAAHNFIKYTSAREHNQRQILSEKLGTDDDPVAELLYAELAKTLRRDPDVKALFEQDELHALQTLEDFVLPRYFSGYWSKFQIKMYAFLADSSAWGHLPSVRPMPFREIQRRIDRDGEPTSLVDNLYYLQNTEDLTTYLAVLPLHYSLAPKADGYFIFEMSAKPFPQQMGFPVLLMDESARTKNELNQYASARYLNGKLINSRGNYPYQSHPTKFLSIDKYQYYTTHGGYEHLITKIDPSVLVVLSKEIKSTLDKATTFSYLCALFAILFALGRMAHILLVHKSPLRFNLNQRIQLLLVFLTLTSMLLFAFANRYYIEQKYAEKNRRQIGEKMQSVLLEVKNNLDEEEILDYSMSDYLNRLMSHFSYIFFTDIHLYSPQGDLVASSQMRMFNEGLMARKINPEAYVHLAYLDEIDFVHEERIGNLTYLSAYTPFYNKQGELLAYLNLPYFAKQAELENEISSFLVSVINIFVLLFILSILVGLFISQWITAPLRAIRESLASVELGKTNRMINHHGNDEIGLLVSEYNAKVAELEHNAEKLAQSERESAWREMAKQVAHEIKNPLTPMKLSVQHMQRSIEQGAEPNRDQINRMASNLIEQIDALSEIASAFSNFARMPVAKHEVIDLVAVLTGATSLFGSFDNILIKLDTSIYEKALIKSDKEQMIRVFNNLIKNALQSIPKSEKGLITIALKAEEGGYLISVADNGSGIDPVDYNRIFVPNFTTKSRGMGLGLAMSKNIVENSKGRIWFESTKGDGSTFYVWLPGL